MRIFNLIGGKRIGGKATLILLFIICSFSVGAQNPSLEMAAGDGIPTGNGPVLTTTVQLQKNTDNPTGNTFATYNSPSALTVTATLSNQQYDLSALATPDGTVFLGYRSTGSVAIFQTMDNLGAPSDANFTSTGAAAGTGIAVVSNSVIELMAVTNTLRAAGRATNARWQMADITFTFSRPVNNPILHLVGLGGTVGSLAFTGEFDFVSANVPVSFSKLSGSSDFSVNATQILNTAGAPAASGAGVGTGSVLVTGTGVTTITLRMYIRGNGGGANWANDVTGTAPAGDAFTMGISVAESDLAIGEAVSNLTPNIGSNVNFTLTATNNGASNNTSVSVTDLLPAGYTYVSSTPSTGTYNSGTGVWTIGNLNSGASATLTITATVKSTGSYINTATITSGSGINDPNSVNNTAVASISPARDSDGDGVYDPTDLDDDNDGILDCEDKGITSATAVEQLFELNGNASKIAQKEVQLTPNLGYQAGQMWAYSKVDFASSFSLTFDGYFGSTDAGGADGIAAVFHNSPLGVNAIGATGDGMGARGIANGVVLEMDTWDNGTGFGDLAGDHGQIWDSDDQTATGFLSNSISLANLENSAWHTVVINWNAATLTLSFTVDGVTAGSYTGDLATNYFGGATKVFFGYTASTGGSMNDQRVRFSDFCSNLPLGIDTDSDGTPDQLDLDSDGDGCADAIEGDENVAPSQLTAQRISGAVDINGVPVLVNTGGSADIGSDQGQGAGIARNASLQESVSISSQPLVTQTLCQNTTPTNLTITASGSPVITYQWYSNTTASNSGGTAITSATSATYSPPTAIAGTKYYYVVATGSCGSISSNVSTVIVNSAPTITLTGTPINLCYSTGTQPLSINYSAVTNSPTTFTLVSGGYTVVSDAPMTASPLVVTVPAGTAVGSYTAILTLKNANGCVSADNTFTVNINSLPSAPVVSSANVSNVCPSLTVNLTSLVTSATPSGGTLYFKTTNSPAGANVATPTAVGAGTYYMFYTNSSGCYSSSTPVSVTINPCTNLSVTKSVDNSSPLVGTDVTFTIIATNGGPSAATGVSVSDVLSATGYTYKSSSATLGSYNNATGVWTIGALANGASATLTLVATVKP